MGFTRKWSVANGHVAELVEDHMADPQHLGPPAGGELQDPAERGLDAGRAVHPGLDRPMQVPPSAPQHGMGGELANIGSRALV